LWEKVWEQRSSLMAVARRRTLSHEEAEDAVSEAMLAAVEADLDPDRVGAWLNRVTQFRCVDMQREHSRVGKRWAYTLGLERCAMTPEEEVCEREHARWVTEQVAALPSRQRSALELRAAGRSVSAIAEALGTPYKATESLLSRGRAQLRQTVTAIAALLGSLFVSARRSSAPAGAVLVSVVALSLAPAQSSAPSPVPSTDRAPRVTLESAGREVPEPDAAPQTAPGTNPRTDAPPPAVSTKVPTGPPPAESPRDTVTRVDAGADATGVTVEHRRTDADETLMETVERCLRDGPIVSTELIGCPPASD
jgi:RNA polymerase sigma factor (sigma-70 family)